MTQNTLDWVTPTQGVKFGAIGPGQILNGHAHNYDHITYCTKGKITVKELLLVGIKDVDTGDIRTFEDKERNDFTLSSMSLTRHKIEQPESYISAIKGLSIPVFDIVKERVLDSKRLDNFMNIKAKTWHIIVGDKDFDANHYHCIYSHRGPDGEISDSFQGWMIGYE